MYCDVCTRHNLWQTTKNFDKKTGRRWMKCRNCDNDQLQEAQHGLRVAPKILYIDIESALMKVNLYELFGERNKSLSWKMLNTKRFIICWSAAWVELGTYKITKQMSDVVTQREAVKQDDRRVLHGIFNLMDESDYIVGHNSTAFDVKLIKWRFLKHNMGFPTKSKLRDTLQMARTETKPESRGLEYLSTEFGGDVKHGLDADEWREIVDTGNPKLLAKADRYCRGDVREGVGVLKRYATAIEQSGKILFR
jgi:hypothetical protein